MCDGESGKKFKIEGEKFERVKKSSQEFDALKDRFVEELIDAKNKVRDAHKRMWEEIHKAVPELEKDGDYALSTKFENIGIYVIEERVKKKEKPSFQSLLKALA